MKIINDRIIGTLTPEEQASVAQEYTVQSLQAGYTDKSGDVEPVSQEQEAPIEANASAYGAYLKVTPSPVVIPVGETRALRVRCNGRWQVYATSIGLNTSPSTVQRGDGELFISNSNATDARSVIVRGGEDDEITVTVDVRPSY